MDGLRRRCFWSGLVSALCLFALVPTEQARAEEAAAGEARADELWITLGADAFATLASRPDLSFEARPLKAESQRAGVVVTRIHPQDVENVSALLHAAHGRCGGFMAHARAADAEAALRAASLPEVKALPRAFEIDQGSTVRDLQSKLQRDRIRDTVERLSTDFENRFYLHPSGRRASNFIRNLWRGYAGGRPEVTVELYEHAGWPQPSVILTIPGSTVPEEVVVLGGHMDSITSENADPDFVAPGADDNASGIATLSEVIRVALANGFRPSRTVQFMAYAAEEVGLRGSQDIADAYRRDGVEVVAVLQLDMTAFNGSVDDVVLISDFTNDELTRFTGRLVDTYQPALSRTSSACGYACSDHASWTAAGFPAVFPHEARFGEGNPVIHTADDTLAVFNDNANHAIKFARLATAFVVETSVVPATPPAAPTDLSASAVSSTAVELAWTDNSADETGFDVEASTGGPFNAVASAEADTAVITVTGLTSGTDYTFRVRARNDGGVSDWSPTATARTGGETPPSSLQATALSATEVRLDWVDRSGGESGFAVEASTGGAFVPVADASANATTVTVGGLAPQTEHVFRVRAVGGAGDSTYSPEASATTFVGDPEPCLADDVTLCLVGGRFQVRVDRQVNGESGPGYVVPGASDDSGLLYFFTADNWELLVKVLDGCGLNGHFWVFSAATTNLEYTLTVVDSWTGFRSVYENVAGTAARAVTDAEAFETCTATEPDS